MGIKNLLPSLKEHAVVKKRKAGLVVLNRGVITRRNVQDYAAKRVVVDGSVWLHSGSCCCARELCLGESTNK